MVLALIGLTCSITAQYFAAKAAVHFAGDLRHRLFAHIQRLPHSQQDRLGSDTLITPHDQRYQPGADRRQFDITAAAGGRPLSSSGAMVMACTIDLRSAEIFLGVIAALSVVVFGIMLWSIPAIRRCSSVSIRSWAPRGKTCPASGPAGLWTPAAGDGAL